MVICPIAIAVGCEKCPAFKVCPMTRVLGDQKAAPTDSEGSKKAKGASKPGAKKG
jgi:hypothetical protein